MEIKQFLSDLNLSDKQSTIYLASLKYGPQTASTLSRKTGIPRSTVIFTFNELIQKGFASRNTKQNATYFSALKPASIEYMLMEKAAQTRKQLVDFKTILPFLNSLENKLSSMPKVQYYEGIEGLKKIVDDSCSKDEEVLFISNNNDMHPELREYIEAIYIPKIATHKSKGKMLINDGEKSKKHVEKIRKVKSDQKDEIIFIDPKKYPFKVTTIIHDNKVSFASYDPKDMTGIIIENTLFADHMRTVFNVLMDHFKSQNN